MKRVWLTTTVRMTMTALWLTVLLICSFNGSALADGLTMQADVGFDGSYLMDQWTPVKVLIENTGKDLEGNLEVLVHSETGRSVIYAVPVVIPNTSSKEYTVFVKMQGLTRTLDIQFVDNNEKVISSIEAKDLTPITRDKYMLGLVTDDDPSLGYWKDRMDGNMLFSNYQPISLSTETFPDRKEILDNFSVMIINNIDTSSFTEEQITALDAWVADGGILIIGTGSNGKRTLSGLSNRIVPVESGEVSQIDAATALEDIAGKPILGEIPLDVMDLQMDGGSLLVNQEANNLIWLNQKDSGWIYTAAFDIGTEPIISWIGNKLLWENLLAESLPEQTTLTLRNPFSEYENSGGVEEVLGYIEAMDLPSAAVVLFVLLLYLGLVGPMNYIILKKIDKREWSWFTIPALSVVFALAIYGLGYNAKGGELIMNTVSIVEMDSDSKSAELTNYVGIFIPKRGDYQIDVDRDALLALNQQNTNGSYFPEVSDRGIVEARILQGKPSQIIFNDVNVWTMKTFIMGKQRVDYGSMDADLYYENGIIKGTVENNTLYPLEDLVLYTPTAYTKVGNIAAGEKKNVEIEIPVQTQSQNNYNNYYMMMDELYPYPSGITAGNDRESTVRRRLFEALYMNEGVKAAAISKIPTPETSNQDFSLKYFAFYEGELDGSILINGKQPDTSLGRGILSGELYVDIEKEGFISIPPGLMSGKYESEMSKNAIYEKDSVYINDFRDYAVFSIDMSPYTDLIDLRAQIGIAYQYGQGELYIYDLEKEDYIEVEGSVINLDDNNKDQYIDVDGDIYLKVQPLIDQSVEVGSPTVALEGRLP